MGNRFHKSDKIVDPLMEFIGNQRESSENEEKLKELLISNHPCYPRKIQVNPYYLDSFYPFEYCVELWKFDFAKIVVDNMVSRDTNWNRVFCYRTLWYLMTNQQDKLLSTLFLHYKKNKVNEEDLVKNNCVESVKTLSA